MEFLDRFDDLAEQAAGGGLEGLDGGPTVDDAVEAVTEIAEGRWDGRDRGLEAIIERFTRPVYLVQNSTFGPPSDDFDNSEFISERLETARSSIESVIPSAGRIDLVNHRMAWVGTGWMVASGVIVTNRHVAEEFASASGDTFVFDENFDGTFVEANIDFRHEHRRPDVARFAVTRVLWIEPRGSFDVALLEVAETDAKGDPRPPIVELLDDEDIAKSIDRWVGVVGYPARDSRNDLQHQQRIFDGIYNVKRLSPGKVTGVSDLTIEHDATTLGGSSGGCVIDLESGRALAIHFGGRQSEDNFGVKASDLAEILREHAAQ